ncbi:methyltransferase family protein [Reichenbachiella ulvae]|uniref:Isoprenylcysteine carboxylmethyltransferase family protein n=1 Tax=Reichenbachiella ulvae TaxID=2980104 RepID=A0ABT3CVP4_9BACT|nr:isoprenylcysteine carboxylmethyltransferase family protein [Reichenbachiella ulvae]MCV9387313.1 isoprenylcysteine carboxylmethyltransferase family protein [Reichenbachiella ulvae]
MYLFLFFICFYLIVFVLRSLIVWKRTGINPFTFSRTDDAHSSNGNVFKIISILELTLVGLYAFRLDWYDYLLPFWYLESTTLAYVGWGLLFFSLIWIWIAQVQMSRSWRIGIDEVNTTELVTHGLFSFSRNPIFLGIMTANLGLFLILPNAFTLLIVALSTVTINTQIRLEEAFLKLEHGQPYLDYQKKTRRWIGSN